MPAQVTVLASCPGESQQYACLLQVCSKCSELISCFVLGRRYGPLAFLISRGSRPSLGTATNGADQTVIGISSMEYIRAGIVSLAGRVHGSGQEAVFDLRVRTLTANGPQFGNLLRSVGSDLCRCGSLAATLSSQIDRIYRLLHSPLPRSGFPRRSNRQCGPNSHRCQQHSRHRTRSHHSYRTKRRRQSSPDSVRPGCSK
jgi:hypothetical protein